MCVGEYGSENKRPHYHMLLFCRDEVTEDEILNSWKHGSIHVGKVSGKSIAYTLKYIDKPGRIPAHKRDDRQKEFRLMSKGIGADYLSPAVVQYHKADISRLYTTQDKFKVPMSKYYRKKIWTPDELEKQVVVIQNNVETQEQKAQKEWLSKNPGGDYDAYLAQARKGRYHNFYNSLKKRK